MTGKNIIEMPLCSCSQGLNAGINTIPPAELAVIHARDSCNYAARLRVTVAYPIDLTSEFWVERGAHFV